MDVKESVLNHFKIKFKSPMSKIADEKVLVYISSSCFRGTNMMLALFIFSQNRDDGKRFILLQNQI
jgi:hypothetical protein